MNCTLNPTRYILRGTIVNRTYVIHKNQYIFNHFYLQYLFLLTRVPRNSSLCSRLVQDGAPIRTLRLARPDSVFLAGGPILYCRACMYRWQVPWYGLFEETSDSTAVHSQDETAVCQVEAPFFPCPPRPKKKHRPEYHTRYRTPGTFCLPCILLHMSCVHPKQGVAGTYASVASGVLSSLMLLYELQATGRGALSCIGSTLPEFFAPSTGTLAGGRSQRSEQAALAG